MMVRRSLAVAIALAFTMLVVGCCQTGPSIRVTPSEVELVASGTVEFTASVKCLDNTGVTWTATCGSISGTGSRAMYSAPAEPGSCTVMATSVVRSDLSASALVTVTVTVPDPDSGPVDPPPAATGTVEGTVYMPDGLTPMSDAFVGVPREPATASLAARQTQYDVIEDDWVTHTLSGADGSFSLLNVPAGLTTLRIIKGQWSRTLEVNVSEDETTTLTSEDTTLPSTPVEGAPNIAVITGAHDRMEDVLAKIGLGDVDTNGHLVPGTEQFDVYDGYAETEQLVSDAGLLNTYDIVFINCGAGVSWFLPVTEQNLRNFVSQGGVLYLTDLTFPIVRTAFPGRVQFRGSGIAGITTDAEVLTEDSVGQSFGNWLANENVLNPDGTVHIAGFAGGWAVIDSVDDSVRVWIRGEVSYQIDDLDFDWGDLDDWELGATDAAVEGQCCRQPAISPSQWQPETSVRPLTVSFSHGAGRVLFTSYHTVHRQPRPELYPQEVVLAGLVFEM